MAAPGWVVAMVLLLLSAVLRLAAAEPLTRVFDVPADLAEKTLRLFSVQSGFEVLFSSDAAHGVRTNAIKGEFSPREAVNRMLAGTALHVRDERNGVFHLGLVDPRKNGPAPPAPGDGARSINKKSSAHSRDPPAAAPPSAPQNPPSTPPTQHNESPPVKNRTFFALLAGWLAAGTPAAIAQSTGTIEGRVFNAATGSALVNAQVTIEGTARQATTDDSGSYRLAGVPAGEARLGVAYAGMERESATVNVPAGGAVQREFELRLLGTGGAGEVVKLDAFNVVADREMSAQAIAMNEQRYAPNIKNVVSIDEYGDRGGENIGEFLRFMPGVAVIGIPEAGNLSLRGIPSDNTNMSIDGAPVASAEPSSRSVNLQAVPMANVSRVEITKVPTPDTPASGLGGSVNLITASAFDKKRPEFSYQVYWQFDDTTGITLGGGRQWQLPEMNTKFHKPSVQLRYARPLTRNFALTLGADYTWRRMIQGDEQGTWDQVRLVQTSAAWADLTQPITTRSAQLGAEWRLGPSDTLSLSLHHREHERWTTRSQFASQYGAGTTGDATFSQGAPTGVGSVSHGSNWNLLVTETNQATLKYRHLGRSWRLDAVGSWSESEAVQDDIKKGFFFTGNASITNLILRGDGIGTAGGILPARHSAVTRTGAPVDIYNGANYSINYGQSSEQTRGGKLANGRLDLSREWNAVVPIGIKIGAAANEERRDLRSGIRQWNFRPNGASDVTSRLAANFDVFDEGFLREPPKVAGFPLRLTSQKKLFDLYRLHPDWFVLDEPLAHRNLVAGSRAYKETITSAYVRADLRLIQNRLWIATGVRFEQTSGKGQGPLDDINAQYQRDAAGNFLRNASGQRILITSDALALAKLRYREREAQSSTDYGDFFPSLNATFDLTEKLVLRAAYAGTIGRPRLDFITPGITISAPEVANPTITLNNPNLKPWKAQNFDLSLEAYNFKDGVGSIGVFQKDIRNFFGDLRTPVTPELLALYGLENDSSLLNYSISTQINAGDAKVTGLEFGYRQSLTFLPHWARGLQVFVSATKLKVQGSSTSDFVGFAPEVFSGGVNLIRPRFYIKANFSFQAETRGAAFPASATIPVGTFDYQGKVTRLALSAQYAFSRSVALYIALTDLLPVSQDSRRYAPQTPEYARTRRAQALNSYTTIGVKGSF